jgi:hypothetical protein
MRTKYFSLSLDACLPVGRGEGGGEGEVTSIPLPFTLLDKALDPTLVVSNASYLTG